MFFNKTIINSPKLCISEKTLFIILLLLLIFHSSPIAAQQLPGFMISGLYDEQQMVIENSPPGTRILINAPLKGFEKDDQVLLVFYALPNGSTIEQTIGKKLKEGDDPLFDAQQIGAQTRYLRRVLRKQTIVIIYLETARHSWPSWKAETPDYREKVKKMIDETRAIFALWNPQIALNGHSGGGRFIFSYLDAVEEIPDFVTRIGFLDSTYGYEDSTYGPKLVRWLRSGSQKYLCALAYNDSVVIYNGKPLVSPTGGTWYRTKSMRNYLSGSFRFKQKDNDSLIWNSTRRRNVEIILKNNPDGKIFHTVQVSLNGFIHSMLNGTKYEQKNYAYFGPRAYSYFITDTVIVRMH
jgi:hypothetical protein